MSSVHEGVSCDGCMAPNFGGDRYKCLRCYDFDLCARCYAEERVGGGASADPNRTIRDSSEEHLPSHPMQCIMTQQDFEMAYQGDQTHSWERLRVVIFTCPVCGMNGLSRERLVSHVIEEHSGPSQSAQPFEMACPICISTDFYRIGFGDYMPNHLTDMVAHMQEHHMQSQFTNFPRSSTPNGNARCILSEYLRDQDLRRVIVHNMPLITNEVGADDNGAAGGAAPSPRVQRVELLRVNRRTSEGYIESFQGENLEGGNNAAANNSAAAPGSLSSASANRGEIVSRQQDRSVETIRPLLDTFLAEALPPESFVHLRSNPELVGDASAVIRTVQYPFATSLRPLIPSHASHRNTRHPGNGAEPSRFWWGSGYPRRYFFRDREYVFNEAVASRRENETFASGITSSGDDSRIAANGYQPRLTVHPTHRIQSAGGQTTSNVIPPSESEEESLPVSVVSSDLSSSDDHEWINAMDTAVDDAVDSMCLTEDVNAAPPAALKPSLVTAETLEIADGASQKSTVAESDFFQNQVDDEVVRGMGEVHRPIRCCTLFTALRHPSMLPVLKLDRTGDEMFLQTGMKGSGSELPTAVKDANEKSKTEIVGSDSMIAESGSSDMERARNANTLCTAVVFPELVMRIGRPLQSTFMQRFLGVSPERSSEKLDEFGDWWTSQISHTLRTESLTRSSQGSALPEAANSTQPATDHVVMARGEAALSRAMEVLRRLDARSARNNRSPAPPDDVTQTSNPAYLNGNIVAPAASGPRQNQIYHSTLESTLFLGTDSVAEAVAREVAALSEASCLNIRQLQNLVRRDDQIAHHPPSSVRPPTGRVFVPASARSDGRVRRSARTLAKDNEQREDDSSEQIHNAFKAPTIATVLSAEVMTTNRIYKPYNVRKDEDSETVLASFIGEETKKDEQLGWFDAQLAESIEQMIPGMRSADSADMRESASELTPVDESVVLGSYGNDKEVYAEKCESLGLKQPQTNYVAAGYFGGDTAESKGSDVDHLKDSRFLRTRRDNSTLKRPDDLSEANAFLPSDGRFLRQLLFGVVDAPISPYTRDQYLPDMFSRVVLSNLRFPPLGTGTKVVTEKQESASVTWTEETEKQWNKTKERRGMETAPEDVAPELWHFLDLASFFEKPFQDDK